MALGTVGKIQCFSLFNGDRVILLANNPFGAPDLTHGATGTVICCDSDDPQRPIFVSWDDWTQGKSNDQFCHTSIWPYEEGSGWWVACSQIGKLLAQ